MSRIYSVANAPQERAAMVFGAGLTRSGRPTPILRDRVQTAANLYLTGKVEKLLMSGGEWSYARSEPESMREYAISLGVPAEAIVLDHGGQRTYDTCYRAKAVFALDSALLVTQAFHLPRALFVCNALGLKAEGVERRQALLAGDVAHLERSRAVCHRRGARGRIRQPAPADPR
jgi:SanA protein